MARPILTDVGTSTRRIPDTWLIRRKAGNCEGKGRRCGHRMVENSVATLQLQLRDPMIVVVSYQRLYRQSPLVDNLDIFTRKMDLHSRISWRNLRDMHMPLQQTLLQRLLRAGGGLTEKLERINIDGKLCKNHEQIQREQSWSRLPSKVSTLDS